MSDVAFKTHQLTQMTTISREALEQAEADFLAIMGKPADQWFRDELEKVVEPSDFRAAEAFVRQDMARRWRGEPVNEKPMSVNEAMCEIKRTGELMDQWGARMDEADKIRTAARENWNKAYEEHERAKKALLLASGAKTL